MPDIDEEVRAALAADPNYPLGEPDAIKWAVAFRQIATMANPLGKALRKFPDGQSQHDLIDIMAGWFANAMASARSAALIDDGWPFVVENTDGLFVASFGTRLLADLFVEEGNGCYRYRVADTGNEPVGRS